MLIGFRSVTVLGLPTPLPKAIALLFLCKVWEILMGKAPWGSQGGLARVPLLTGPPGLCAGSVVKGRLPQLGEKVLVKAAYNPGQAVPWNAVKVQTLSNQVFISP